MRDEDKRLLDEAETVFTPYDGDGRSMLARRMLVSYRAACEREDAAYRRGFEAARQEAVDVLSFTASVYAAEGAPKWAQAVHHALIEDRDRIAALEPKEVKA